VPRRGTILYSPRSRGEHGKNKNEGGGQIVYGLCRISNLIGELWGESGKGKFQG
jgi:hypothetical protein